MDLTKILNRDDSFNPHVSLVQHGIIFFEQLILQLQTDLQFLQTQPQVNQTQFFNKTRILHGNLDINEKKYLFLQLPNTSGFLIESSVENEIFKMHRATKVNPILHSDLGKTTRPEIFVIKSMELEEFRVLDDCFVRTTSSDRTLSVKQMSEMLLLLAESVRLT